jgi:anti-sigma B factor antagonist
VIICRAVNCKVILNGKQASFFDASILDKIMSSDVKVLQPQGILDGTKATQFRQDISESVLAGAKTVLIDFQDVTFMDSSGLGALVLALKTVRGAGSKLVVCSINEQIRILFELTSMDRVFDIFESREAFESELMTQNS